MLADVNRDVSPAPKRRGKLFRATGLAKAYCASYGIVCVAILTATVAPDPYFTWIRWAGVAAFLGCFLISFAWLYCMWSRVPREHARFGSTQVTPGAAVGRLFIPVYNLYWMFAAYVGLCDSIDRALLDLGKRRMAPWNLAFVFCIYEIFVGFVPPVAQDTFGRIAIVLLFWGIPTLTLAYMLRTETAMRTMHRALVKADDRYATGS